VGLIDVYHRLSPSREVLAKVRHREYYLHALRVVQVSRTVEITHWTDYAGLRGPFIVLCSANSDQRVSHDRENACLDQIIAYVECLVIMLV
jgi:hypothetical protein